MSRASAITDAAAVLYLGQAITLLTNFLVVPLTLSYLGDVNYGVWLVCVQTVLYLYLLHLGVLYVLPRNVATLVGQSEFATARQTIEVSLTLLTCSGWSVAVGLIIADAFALLGRFDRVFVWMAIFYTSCLPIMLFSTVLYSVGDLKVPTLISVCSQLVSSFMSIGLLAGGFGMISLMIGFATGHLINHCWCAVRFYRKNPALFPSRIRLPTVTPAGQLLTAGFFMSVSASAQMLTSGNELFVIAVRLGPEKVTAFNCSLRLLMTLAAQTMVAVQLAAPALSQIGASGDPVRRKMAVRMLVVTQAVASGGLTVLFLAVNHHFVTFWLGMAAPQLDHTLEAVAACAILSRHLSAVLATALVAFGSERAVCSVMCVEAALTISLSFMLTGPFVC